MQRAGLGVDDEVAGVVVVQLRVGPTQPGECTPPRPGPGAGDEQDRSPTPVTGSDLVRDFQRLHRLGPDLLARAAGAAATPAPARPERDTGMRRSSAASARIIVNNFMIPATVTGARPPARSCLAQAWAASPVTAPMAVSPHRD